MDLKKINQILLNSQSLAITLLFFLVPIVLWPNTSEVFEFNKLLVVYLFTGISLGLHLSLSLVNKKFLFKKTPLDIPILIFLLSQLLSVVFSIHPTTSLWGYYSRFHGGLISYLCYTYLYYQYVTLHSCLPESSDKVITKSKLNNTVLTSILVSGFLVAFYGVLEHFGIDKHIWIQDVQNRVFSTIGQPNWLSAYLVALLPISLHLFIVQKSTKQKAIWAATALIFFASILFTKSRSGIATTFIILILFSLKLSKKDFIKTVKAKSIPLVAILFLTLIIGTPWTPNPAEIKNRLDLGGPIWSEVESYLQKIGLTTQIKPLETERLDKETQDLISKRSQGIRVGGSSSWEIRNTVWKGALTLFQQRPLFGTGVETFGYSYYWARPIEHNNLSEWDFLYNKAHNEYLNFLATTGLIGLLSYLYLCVSILYLITKSSSPYKFPLLLSILSILITNYFGFSVVVIGLFFFFFPAFVQTTSDNNVKGLLADEKRTANQYVPLGLFLIFTILTTLIVYRIWNADINYNNGRSYAQAGYIAQSIKFLEDAVALSPNESNFLSQLGESYALAALSLDQRAKVATDSATTRQNFEGQRDIFVIKADQVSNEALLKNPYHLNILKGKIKIELTLGQIDPKYFENSKNTLNRAIELSPTDPKLVYNLGLVYEYTGDLEMAKTALQKALDLKPDYEAVKEDLKRLESSSKN